MEEIEREYQTRESMAPVKKKKSMGISPQNQNKKIKNYI